MSAQEYDLLGGAKKKVAKKEQRTMKTVYRRIWEGRADAADLRRTKLRKGDLKELKNGSIGSKAKSRAAKQRLRENPALAASFRANAATVASGGVPRKGQNSVKRSRSRSPRHSRR